MPCKHVYAVEYLITWKTDTAGQQTVVTTTETVKVTYKQNWPAYNAAQAEEKARFIVLLNALCQLVEQPVQATGRPRLPLGRYGLCLCLQGVCGLLLPPLHQ
jgi:hypothetical protein